MSIDLHSHSYYSDGFLSPQALIELAKKQGCQTLCLSDHDTTAGLDEAQDTADKLGVNLIHGVEASALWQQQTVHIVGLGIDKNNTILQAGLKQHQIFRKQRARLMAKGLEQVGIKDAYHKTLKFAPKKMLTRTHFAKMLIDEKICSNMGSVFKRYLTGNRPGSVAPQWQAMSAVINWIHQAGGLAVLAHPFRYRFTNAKVGRLLSAFGEMGGDGLEVVVGGSLLEEVNKAAQLALKYNLLGSMGSDYHGWAGEYRQLGKLPPLPNSITPIWSKLNTIKYQA